MADITRRIPDCDEDCERGERGERGRRGRTGDTGPTGPTGPDASVLTDQVNILGDGSPGDILRFNTFEPFSPQIITIFVRPGGSDVTGDGSLANPFATLQHAVMFVPMLVPAGDIYMIDITGITEVLPVDYTLPAWSVPESMRQNVGADPFLFVLNGVMIVATPQLVPLVPASDATINVGDLPVVTADPVTQMRTITLPVARLSWGIDGLKGKFLIDGTSSSRNAVITSNTTTTISYTTLTGDGATGFPLRIMEPSATLTGTSLRKAALSAINIGSIGFNGIRISNSVPGQRGLYIDTPGYASCVLCELDSPGGVPTLGDILPMRCDFIQGTWLKGNCLLSSYRTLFLRNCLLDTCVTATTPGNLLKFRDCKALFFTRCVFDGCGAIAPVNDIFSSSRNVNAATVVWWFFDHCLVRNSPNPLAAIFFSGSYGYFFRNDIYGNTGSGIVCSAGAGLLHLDFVRTQGGLPNGTLGIEVRHGLRALPNADTYLAAAGTELRGVSGDMMVGTFPIRSWADFAAAAPPSGHPTLNEFDVNPPVIGTGDSFTVAAGIVTLTDAGPPLFTADMVGRMITISGATSPGNDGVFVIASFIDANNITFANAAGVTEAFAGTWQVVPVNGATGSGSQIIASTP